MILRRLKLRARASLLGAASSATWMRSSRSISSAKHGNTRQRRQPRRGSDARDGPFRLGDGRGRRVPRRARHGARRRCRADVLFAGRSFRRAPLVALTIVTTVGLGLGLVAVVFTFLNAVIFAWTRCATRTSCSRSTSAIGQWSRALHAPAYDALVRETGVFSDVFATGPTSTAGSMAGGWRARS